LARDIRRYLAIEGEKMAEKKRNEEGKLPCPLCGEGIIRGNDKQVFCSNYKIEKDGDEYVKTGSCDFHIFLDQTKSFKRKLTTQEVVDMIEKDKVLTNSQKDTMALDLESEYFTTITWAGAKDL
jgi:hypothetical protein